MGTLESKLIISATDKTGPATKTAADNMSRLNKTADSFDRRAARMDAMAARVKMSADRMSLVAPLMATAAIGAVKKGLVEFADLDRKMTRIGITADASAEETKAAFSSIERQAKAIGLPLEQGIRAMDTLTASGMNMQQALDFLPSVLATTQASGAAAEDIANAGLKAASAFKIEASDMQSAFDDMAYSGKSGQFELKDMATYIPSLASSFAALGYKGEDGLKRLLAMLQTIRAHTGTAEEAATDAQNIFGKMLSNETITRFKKLAGINLPAELKKATQNGEDLTEAFIRLSKEALHGDMSKLPQLFNDQQMRLGMQALIGDTDELRRQLELLNSTQVAGTVARDLKRVAEDTASSIEKLSQSYDHFIRSIGQKVAPTAVTAMDALSNGIDIGIAKDAGMEKLGWNWLHRQLGPVNADEWFKVLKAGGYSDPEFQKGYEKRQYQVGGHKAAVGSAAVGAEPGVSVDHGYTPKNLPKDGAPIPEARPDIAGDRQAEKDQKYQDMRWGEQQSTADPRNPSAVMREWQKATEGKDPLGEGPGPGGLFDGFDWKHFLFGKGADGTSLRDALKMEMGRPGQPSDPTPSIGQTERQSGTQKVEVVNQKERPNIAITVNAPVTVNQTNDGAALAHTFADHLRSEMSGLHADLESPGGSY
jgi:TP901 family phage tail tape measure protein